MRNPIVQFKDEIGTGETKAAALKRKKFANIFIPLFLGACVVALVLVVMYEEPQHPAMVTDEDEAAKNMTESMQIAAIAGGVEDMDAPQAAHDTESVREKSRAEIAAAKKKSPFAVGDIVVPTGECLGFAEASDLATFRSMLQHGDIPKARKFYEQLHRTRNGGKISPDEEMSVLSINWNGSVLVEVGTYHWWVAPDWIKFPAAEGESSEN